MKKQRTDRNFLNKPAYPGGKNAMSTFIKQHLKYPEEAQKLGIKGIVQVKITISSSGNVIDTEVVHSLGHGCDEEATRVAALLKFEVPKNRGVKVKFFKRVNFGFGRVQVQKKLQKKASPQHSQQIYSSTSPTITSYTYNVVSTPTPTKEIKKPDTGK